MRDSVGGASSSRQSRTAACASGVAWWMGIELKAAGCPTQHRLRGARRAPGQGDVRAAGRCGAAGRAGQSDWAVAGWLTRRCALWPCALTLCSQVPRPWSEGCCLLSRDQGVDPRSRPGGIRPRYASGPSPRADPARPDKVNCFGRRPGSHGWRSHRIHWPRWSARSEAGTNDVDTDERCKTINGERAGHPGSDQRHDHRGQQSRTASDQHQLTVHSRDIHQAQLAARAAQGTKDFEARFALRAGVEATIRQPVLMPPSGRGHHRHAARPLPGTSQDPPRTHQRRRRSQPDPAARLLERPPTRPDPHQPPRPPRTRPGPMNTN